MRAPVSDLTHAVNKTHAEATATAKLHAAKRKVTAERRAQQQANVQAKKDARAKSKGKSVTIQADGEDDESAAEEVDEFAYEDLLEGADGDEAAFDPMDVLDEVLDQPTDAEDGSEEGDEPAPVAKRSKTDAPKAKFSMRGKRPR